MHTKSLNKGLPVGKSLYKSAILFADINQFIDDNIQRRIKEYLYCKQFNSAPYPTMEETPANIIDDFMIIDEEYTMCQADLNEQKKVN